MAVISQRDGGSHAKEEMAATFLVKSCNFAIKIYPGLIIII